MPLVLLGLGRFVFGSDRCHEVGVSILEFTLKFVDLGTLSTSRLRNPLLLLADLLVEAVLLLLVQHLPLTKLFLIATSVIN